LNEERDLRPATFIREIHEKTHLLEEEKKNYYLNKSVIAQPTPKMHDFHSSFLPSSSFNSGVYRVPKKYYRNVNY
jgi:hypothetical protein